MPKKAPRKSTPDTKKFVGENLHRILSYMFLYPENTKEDLRKQFGVDGTQIKEAVSGLGLVKGGGFPTRKFRQFHEKFYVFVNSRTDFFKGDDFQQHMRDELERLFVRNGAEHVVLAEVDLLFGGHGDVLLKLYCKNADVQEMFLFVGVELRKQPFVASTSTCWTRKNPQDEPQKATV